MLVSEGEGSDIAFSGADGDVEAREFRGFRLWRDVGMSRKAIKPLQRLKGSSCLQPSLCCEGSEKLGCQLSDFWGLAERFITATATATNETKKEFKVSAFLISQLRNVAAKERELKARLQMRG
jgi:hypothetical protein